MGAPGSQDGIDGGIAGETTLLFVYGTLKRRQANHWRLDGATWLGEATLEGAQLFDLGPFPMAVAGEGSIHGEVVAITWTHLASIDAFEGCPRLYERHCLPLRDGRQAWAYLGRSRQVRHVSLLPGGHWPAREPSRDSFSRETSRGSAQAWIWTLLWLLQPIAAHAGGFDTLGACQAWRSSHGVARINLGNAIGAAHSLTKRHPFQESPPEAPVALYSPADLQRVCGR